MPRAGLDRDVVAATAAAILDGGSELSLARVASELGVKPPSLYSHVDGLEGLMRRVAIGAIDGLADACREAVMGVSGRAALVSLAAAYRRFASEHPGVYPLTQVARPDDPEVDAASSRVLEPVMAVLSSWGLEGREAIHAARTIRSAIHGFSLLETSGGFGLDVDQDESFDWMIDVLVAGIDALATPDR